MNKKSLSITFEVDRPASEVFQAINSVSKWWTENIKGSSTELNDEFEVRFGDVHYSRQKLIEVIPDRKVVWLVADSYLSFLADKTEWTGTKISFEISHQRAKTEMRFTHHGLVPEIECYGACSKAWGEYLTGSLLRLITTGKGKPERKDPAVKSL